MDDLRLITEKFLDFEKENDCFSLEYKGIPYWHFIRRQLYNHIAFGSNTDSERHPDLNRSFHEKLGFFPHVLPQIQQFFSRESFDLFVSYVYLRKEVDGKSINPFLYFLDSLGYSEKYDTVFSGNWVSPTPPGHNNSLIELLYIPFWIYNKMGTKLNLVKIPELKLIVKSLNEQFGVSLDYGYYLDSVRTSVIKFKLMKRYFKRLLRNKYKCVIIGCHYNTYNFSMISAARELGIPVVELQHGIINKLHIPYIFKDITAKGKYMPNYIFMFGEYGAKACSLPESTTAIVTGLPLLDYSRERYKDIKRDQKKVVLYSSGTVGRILSQLAIRLADIACPLGYTVVFKLHPNERLTWRQRYPWLVEANNIQIEDRPINIHEILASAKHHAGVASTVFLEAIALETRAYIYHLEKWEWHEDIIKEGYAHLFETETELLQLIQSDEDINTHEIANSFYKSNAIQNMQCAFDAILNKEGSPAKG